MTPDFLIYFDSISSRLKQRWCTTFLLGIIAGVLIGFGGAAATAASYNITDFENLLKALIFPVGLILVVICRAELFTGNILMFSAAIYKKEVTINFLKNLICAYLGNFIGAALAGIIVWVTHAIPYDILSHVSELKCTTLFTETIIKAICCNVFVCLAIWLYNKSIGNIKFLMLYIPIFLFVICGFDHCVADIYYLTAGLLANYGGVNNICNALLYSLLPATIGNIIGGVLISSIIYLRSRTYE